MEKKENSLFLDNVYSILKNARNRAKTAVNLSMVYAYYEVGKMIVEEEQQGENRAAYGKKLLQELSFYLTKNFGKGFSVGNLKNIRQFYKVYSIDRIGETVFSEFENYPETDIRNWHKTDETHSFDFERARIQAGFLVRSKDKLCGAHV